MRAEIRNKRIDTDKDGSRWFRCEVVALDEDGEEVIANSISRALDRFDCDTPCIQKTIDAAKDRVLTAARNMSRIDLEALE